MLGSFLKRHARSATFCWLVAASMVLLVFSNQSTANRPKELGLSIVSVFQLSIARVSGWFTDTWNSVGELRRQKKELDALRAQVASYERTESDVAQIIQENNALREQLGFAEMLPFSQIPASIIAKDPGFFSAFGIDKGRKHGVARGMPVVALQDGLRAVVGKVSDVGLLTSIVVPLLDLSSYVAARHRRSRYEGLVQGKGKHSATVVMQYVSKPAKNVIEYDDLIVTSGTGGVYPRGLHIGRVKGIEAKTHDQFLELDVELVVDFARLEYVFVLRVGQ